MNNANRSLLWLVLAGSVLVGLIACSSDSLWIDEAWIALIASEKNLAGWWARMQEVSGSTLQMPLYCFYIWLWEKLAGHSEWMLRAANTPFFALGQWAMFRVWRDEKRMALWVTGIAAASPFVWSYLNEARPYAMQYGAACLVVAGLIQLAKGRPFATRDLILFCAGLVLLCGSSALAFPWAGMGLLSALLLLWKSRTLRDWSTARVLVTGGTLACLAALFAYDLWATRAGGRASNAGTTSSQNLLFACYELLGFSGLGPPRLAMRESQSFSVLTPYSLSLGILVLALLLALFHPRRIERKVWKILLLYSVIPLLFITLLALVAPFRLLGRHFTAVAPVLFVLLAYAVVSPGRGWLNRIFIIIWFASAITLRFHPRHRRDDYRDAALVARTALDQGDRTWWAADPAGAEYYKVPITKLPGAPKTAALLAGNRSDLGEVSPPDLVILSKSDLFDPSGNLQRYLEQHNFSVTQTLPAFTIWRARH